MRALLQAGADPQLSNEAGLTALDYARRKLMRLNERPPRPTRKSPSLDENNQLDNEVRYRKKDSKTSDYITIQSDGDLAHGNDDGIWTTSEAIK